MVNNESIIADNAAVKEILHSAVENVMKEKTQTPSIRNELFGVEIAKITKWYRGINLIQISLKGNRYWASINYLFHDNTATVCNLPVGSESIDDEGMTYITPSNDIYVNVIPYSNNEKLDYLITGFTDNDNVSMPPFHPERGELILQNGENKISVSPGHIFIKSDHILLSEEPEIINGDDGDDNFSSRSLQSIRQELEEQNIVLKKWSNYDMEPPKPPEPPKTPEKKPEEKKKTEDRELPDEEEYEIIMPKKYDGPEYEGLREAIKELNSLIGLAEVKKKIGDLIALFEFNRGRKKKLPVSKNLVFTGNPGTGKTTVAKIVARIYMGLKVVSNEKVVMTSRAGMVAGWLGQTAGKVRDRFLEAKGGVLFIDEAYSLCKNNNDGYGKEALATMVDLMPDDDKSDTAVILAGYAGPIEDLFGYNEGLRSRFNTYINFADYSPKQLMQIFKRSMKEYNITMNSKAEESLELHFKDLYGERSKGFGNARHVNKIFTSAVKAAIIRIYRENKADHVRQIEFVPSDIDEAIILTSDK